MERPHPEENRVRHCNAVDTAAGLPNLIGLNDPNTLKKNATKALIIPILKSS
jgi:hypothetical protein